MLTNVKTLKTPALAPVLAYAPPATPEAVLDDASLIQGLDAVSEPIDVAPPIYQSESDDSDFDMPSARIDDEDITPLTAGPALDDNYDRNQEGQTIDLVPNLDFDSIGALPEEDCGIGTDDDGESIDIPAGSLGSGDDELSDATQERLAELNDRGIA